MVARSKHEAPLLGISFLCICFAFAPSAFAQAGPDGTAALEDGRTIASSGQASNKLPPGNSHRPLTKVDIEHWMKDLSN